MSVAVLEQLSWWPATESEDIQGKEPTTRAVGVTKNEQVCEVFLGTKGFGFSIKGTTQLGGALVAIAGTLCPLLQYVSSIDEGGAAHAGGVRLHDRLLEVNGNDVRGASHKAVVDHVLRGGGRITLRVLRMPEAEAARLQRIEEGGDVSKRRPRAPSPNPENPILRWWTLRSPRLALLAVAALPQILRTTARLSRSAPPPTQ